MTKKRKRSAGNTPFEIAGQRLEPGQRVRFAFPLAELHTHTSLDVPVEVVHGRQAGPVLLVCAAIHGDELNGVEIIRRLRVMKSLNQLRGTLVLVPVVNIFGFVHQSRYLPDRRDLNRCFPGTARGSIASRMARMFFTKIVKRCTHVIDLHTAAVNRDNVPQIRATMDQDGVKEMALGFNIPIIIHAGLIERSLRCEAGKAGIPVLTYEAGEALRLTEKSIVTGVHGIMNVMRTLGMLPAGSRRIQQVAPAVAHSTSWIRAPASGIFRPMIGLGERVRKDDWLGVVSAPFSSDRDAVLESPFEGIVIGLTRLPIVNEGDALVHIAKFGEASAVEAALSEHHDHVAGDPLYYVDPSVADPDLS